MSVLHTTAPAAIAKHGLTTLSDNLGPGEFVAINRAFFNVFRPELESRFITGVKKPCQDSSSSNCRSGK